MAPGEMSGLCSSTISFLVSDVAGVRAPPWSLEELTIVRCPCPTAARAAVVPPQHLFGGGAQQVTEQIKPGLHRIGRELHVEEQVRPTPRRDGAHTADH